MKSIKSFHENQDLSTCLQTCKKREIWKDIHIYKPYWCISITSHFKPIPIPFIIFIGASHCYLILLGLFSFMLVIRYQAINPAFNTLEEWVGHSHTTKHKCYEWVYVIISPFINYLIISLYSFSFKYSYLISIICTYMISSILNF